MRVESKVDAKAFDRALREYRRQTGKAWPVIIREQTKGLVGLVMRIMPPKSKKQGERAVARDIGNAAVGLQSGFLDFLVEQNGGEGPIRTAYSKGGDTRFVDFPNVDRGGGSLDAWHKGRKNNRGRVKRPSRAGIEGDTWHEPDRLVVNESDFLAYVKEEQRKVGMAKGGLGAVFAALGGRVAAWIRRHDHRGRFRDVTGDKRNPRIHFSNLIRYAGQLVGHRMPWILSSRMRAMRKTLKMEMDRGARRFNRGNRGRRR